MKKAETSIGLIGCGYWGPNLLRNLTAMGVDVAVAEASQDRRAFVADKYPEARLFEHSDPLLADESVTAVVIATPADTHGALARQALEAGKDVFVEKPLSLEAKEAIELATLADDRGRILMVGHTFLFNGAVRALKRRIEDGELGNVYYLYSQRLNLGIVRSDVNAAWNLAPHDVSIACYLLGKDPVSVTATGVRVLQPEQEIDDVVFMTITFEGGVRVHIHVSWLDPQKVRRMTVVGDRKMIVYDDVSDHKLTVYDKGITKEEPVPLEQPHDFARFRMVTRAGDITIPNLKMREPLRVELEHFVECLRTRRRPLSDGWTGVAVSSVLAASDESIKNGGTPVSIEINRPSKEARA